MFFPFPKNKLAVSDRSFAAHFLVSSCRRGAGLEARLQQGSRIWRGAPSIWASWRQIWSGCSKSLRKSTTAVCVELSSARLWSFLVEGRPGALAMDGQLLFFYLQAIMPKQRQGTNVLTFATTLGVGLRWSCSGCGEPSGCVPGINAAGSWQKVQHRR